MVLLSSFGAHLLMSTFMAGKVTPPPSPSNTRMAIRAVKWRPAIKGLSRVGTMLSKTAPKKTHLPPNSSATRPPGIWVMR